MEQRTDAWFQARLGKVTASRVADVMAKTRSGYGASRKNYMMELLCQRLTGIIDQGFTNAAMIRGTELEPVARSMYEVEHDVIVYETGLVDHPRIRNLAASPDGLVRDDGLVEIKCPNTAQHVDFLRTGQIDERYQLQMLLQMDCTDRAWCDFVSFDDRLPEELSIKVVRFHRDEKRIAEMLTEVELFLRELDELQTDLLTLKEKKK